MWPSLHASNGKVWRAGSIVVDLPILPRGDAPVTLSLRASNEGLLRPRVARAQKGDGEIASPNPFLD